MRKTDLKRNKNLKISKGGTTEDSTCVKHSSIYANFSIRPRDGALAYKYLRLGFKKNLPNLPPDSVFIFTYGGKIFLNWLIATPVAVNGHLT